ncbi:MAG: hypothetical protein ACJ73S_05060 [Mycobacteriales bacterium]
MTVGLWAVTPGSVVVNLPYVDGLFVAFAACVVPVRAAARRLELGRRDMRAGRAHQVRRVLAVLCGWYVRYGWYGWFVPVLSGYARCVLGVIRVSS